MPEPAAGQAAEPEGSPSAAVEPVQFLHGIQAGHYDGNDDWQPACVVAFPVTRKTPKRIYYQVRDWGAQQIRFVNRQELESTGEVRSPSRYWWESDYQVYLNPPPVEMTQQPSLAELKQQMADAHPDRGGNDEAFIAARQRYERAKE